MILSIVSRVAVNWRRSDEKMRIIGFVGYPLSGKTTATEVGREMGVPIVVMGDAVRREAEKMGIELTDENLGKLADRLRKEEGMDAIARRCIPEIREKLKEKGVVIVDGIRGLDEIRKFREVFGDDFILIGIEAPPEIRFERIKKRRRTDDVSTLEELIKRDRREEKWGLKEAMESADIIVENTGSFEDFRDKIRHLLEKFATSVDVEIETRIHPTEDEEKVINAIKNLFPDSEIKIERERVVAKARDLRKFKELLKRQKILDTARTEFVKGKRNGEITVYLNKQTATVSRINFCEEKAVLSPLRVTFKLHGVAFSRFLDYVAPETRDGKPVREVDSL
jgi:predicted RNA binding protein with dsRBD fold (UPF0201 family)/cytidylate kinase